MNNLFPVKDGSSKMMSIHSYFRKIIGKAQCLKDELLGPRTLITKEHVLSSTETVTIQTTYGHEIKIYCRVSEHFMCFVRWWVPDRYIKVYHLHCVCSEDTPESVKSLFLRDGHIPSFTSKYLPSLESRKRAINSYIDFMLGTTSVRRKMCKSAFIS